MLKTTLPLLLLLLLFAGCTPHGTRHVPEPDVLRCPSFPCGDEIESRTMNLVYEFDRDPSGDCLLRGTARPKDVPENEDLDFIVISVELLRDITVADSFSFPVPCQGPDRTVPFEKRFTPSGGFDGVTFHWDVQLAR